MEEGTQKLRKRAIRCRGMVQTFTEEESNRGGRVGQSVAEQERKQMLRRGANKAENVEEEVNEKLRRKEPDVEGNQNAEERVLTITKEEGPMQRWRSRANV